MQNPPFHPWFKSELSESALGFKLNLAVPFDVFSNQQIDEGTLLLLKNLPVSQPRTVLDMGCGYGALGLPIAKQFSSAQVLLVDRDLLAVDWAARNAESNSISNIRTQGSLGYENIDPSARFDWILCNVPARIGTPFIESLINTGQAFLSSEGEIRIVVINDLAPVCLELASKNKWTMKEVARGPRHTVFALPKAASLAAPPPGAHGNLDLYFRDTVEFAGLHLDRPFDLGGDDPKRLRSGLPVLLDAFPRAATDLPHKTILCFRIGYGQIPLLCRSRWETSRVLAIDRDLLGIAYGKRNAMNLNLDGPNLEFRGSSHFPDALLPKEKFDLVVGEISPGAGEKVAISEIEAAQRAINPGGQALFLVLEKNVRDWITPWTQKTRIPLAPVISREGYVVLRLQARR